MICHWTKKTDQTWSSALILLFCGRVMLILVDWYQEQIPRVKISDKLSLSGYVTWEVEINQEICTNYSRY